MKRQVLSFVVVAAIALSAILTSCSSPESDGVKAAKMMYNYQDDYVKKRNQIIKEQNKAYETYINKFQSYKFASRIDAREKLNEFLQPSIESFQKLETDYQDWQKKAYEYYNKLGSKYSTNKEKQDKYNYAYRNYQPKNSVTQENYGDYHSRIQSLILSIIPLKPDLERVKNDLTGRSISNLTASQLSNQYSQHNVYSEWKINSLDELKHLKIQDATIKGDEYLLSMCVSLQGKVNNWDANLNVNYVLGKNDDWKLETFSGKMDIVPTGKYGKFIKSQIESVTENRPFLGSSTTNYLKFTNNCSEILIVSGEFLGQYKDWNKFTIFVPANGNATLHSNYTSYFGEHKTVFPKVTDYKITFVERAGL